MKVGYQGTIGAFSQIAAENIFPDAKLNNYLTFKDVIDNVLNDNLDYGILPIENSYTGEVSMVLDELFNSNVYIIDIYNLPIIQNLIGLKTAQLKEIKHVYSREQALMQCSDFLKENNIEMISFANTALASEYVKKLNDPTKAAIASSLTAKIYGLKY